MTASIRIQNDLLPLAEEEYKRFQWGLLPTVARERILGVRTPALKKYAKSIRNTPLAYRFLGELPHYYQEENALHAFLIAELEGDALFQALEDFLPYVDNWAICDGLRPKRLKHDQERLRSATLRWLHSPHLYTRRFAIEMLMLHFLEDPASLDNDLAALSLMESIEYYEQMMLAWYFAEALCHHFDRVLPYFTKGKLKDPVLKMARRKAFDSLKLTTEQKALLKEKTTSST